MPRVLILVSRNLRRVSTNEGKGEGRTGVEEGLGLLVEVGLVGRTAALSHEEELVLVAGNGEEIDLGGEVGAGVHLLVHGERGVLGVSEVEAGVGVVARA